MSDIDDCRKSVERLTRDRGEVMSAGNDKIAEIRARHERIQRDCTLATPPGSMAGQVAAVDAHDDRATLLAEVDRQRAEIERLLQAIGLVTTTVPDMEIDIENPVGMAQRVVAEVDRLRAENEQLRAALRWYADQENHFPVHVHHRRAGYPDPVVVFVKEPQIMDDCGRRARAALESKP